MILDQAFRNLGRVREITAILTKYGFEEFVNATPLHSLIPNRRRLSWKKEQEKKQYSRWELLRMAAEDLGPAYIKLAQALSNRPDLLPAPLILEFEKLQSEVQPLDIQTVREIVERELGKPLSEVFPTFQEAPLGAASIGQVHRATLHNGDEVVVKVQRPGVRKTIETDLDIIKTLVRWGNPQLENQGFYGAKEVVEVFERSLMKELDYHTEARHMEQFRAYYKRKQKFKIPRVYPQFTTHQLLVQEFMPGTKITDVETLAEWGVDTQSLAERGVGIYFSQIFEHGYFHADPHPGNILVQKDGSICLIDFGMMGKLSKHDRLAFAGILVGVAKQNARMMARNFKKLALSMEIEDDRTFEAELGELIEDYATLNIADVDVTDVTLRLQSIIRNNRMRMPPGVFIMMRALTILDGIGRTVHPEFKTFEAVRPYGIKLLRQMYAPDSLVDDTLSTAAEFYDFATSFPYELKEILEKTRQGQLHFVLKNDVDESVMDKATRASNRLVLAIITLGIYVSSAIVLLAYGFYDGPYPLVLLVLFVTGVVTASFFTFALIFGSWWNR